MYRLISDELFTKLSNKYGEIEQELKYCPICLFGITNNDVEKNLNTEYLSNYDNLSEEDFNNITQKSFEFISNNTNKLLDQTYYGVLDDVIDTYYNVFSDFEKENNKDVEIIEKYLDINIKRSELKIIYENENFKLYKYNTYVLIIYNKTQNISILNDNNYNQYSYIYQHHNILFVFHSENKKDKWYSVDMNTGNIKNISITF